ncbi:hypothetical protein GCM10010124_30540 [Pilimelia terevasa]|uniref:Carboxypeptidase regulatory-like domain-containing protein n=1 Tax=Pilimelia terevasa TaxID=53372 RepID=A0A8J3BSZ9_9ACTN|nr:carboxypeptidase regulatory-like domain-containing protein [Pilimelia terevasa]GGK35753.1 hypothetical protein GCM10010124_30540 [Pilimelia terevasa]
MLRAGVAQLAMLGGALIGAAAATAAPATPGQPAAPAPAAAEVEVRILAVSPDQLRSGESATVTFTASHGILGGPGSATVEVGPGLTCTSGCEVTSSIGRVFSARVTAGTLGNGERRRVPVSVVSESDRDERIITVRGPEGPQTARRITGRIVDVATGAGISGAQVGIQDSRGNTRLANTDGGGRFGFEGSEGSVITPGPVRVVAQASEYEQAVTTITVRSNETFNLRLRMRSTNRPTPTPSPTATPAPTDDAVPPAGEETPPAGSGAAEPASSDEESTGPLTWLGVGLGVLLLAGGLAGAWYLNRHRRQDAPVKGAGAPGHPRYPRLDDATAIVNQPRGPAGGADALANAATVVQPAVRDEYADPYGLPPQAPGQPPYLPQQPGPGGPQAWGTPPNYGDATQVGGFAPVDDGAFAQGFPAGTTDAGPGTLPTNPAYHGAGASAYQAPTAPTGYGFGDPGATVPGTAGGLDTTVGGTAVGDVPADDPGARVGAGAAGGFLSSTHDYPGGPAPATGGFGGAFGGPAGGDAGPGPVPHQPGAADAFGSPTALPGRRTDLDADLRTPAYPAGGYPGRDNGYPAPPDTFLAPTGGYPGPAGHSGAPEAAGQPPHDPADDGYPAGESRQGNYPAPQGYTGPAPSPYFPAGAPAPTGETPRYDEPTGHFRPAAGYPAPLTPESYLSGLSQQPGDAPPPPADRPARRAVEWMDD